MQAKGKSRHLKGNLISPTKRCHCGASYTGAAPTLLIQFPALFLHIPGTPILSFVVFTQFSRENKHQYPSRGI